MPPDLDMDNPGRIRIQWARGDYGSFDLAALNRFHASSAGAHQTILNEVVDWVNTFMDCGFVKDWADVDLVSPIRRLLEVGADPNKLFWTCQRFLHTAVRGLILGNPDVSGNPCYTKEMAIRKEIIVLLLDRGFRLRNYPDIQRTFSWTPPHPFERRQSELEPGGGANGLLRFTAAIIIQRAWTARRRNAAAHVIQRAWRLAVSSPPFLVCRRRLRREFDELQSM
jgi:hypothetical protein